MLERHTTVFTIHETRVSGDENFQWHIHLLLSGSSEMPAEERDDRPMENLLKQEICLKIFGAILFPCC